MCILNRKGNMWAFAASDGRCFQKTLAPFKSAKNLFTAWLPVWPANSLGIHELVN